MKKMIMTMAILSTLLSAQTPVDSLLEANCLGCHREQKLPDSLIYRRYLLQYSSPERIEKALIDYLKHPRKDHSIMPSEFFLRFPLKYPTKLDSAMLKESVGKYLEYFDVRRRLRLEK